MSNASKAQIFDELQKIFIEYEAELKELQRKYDNELITASTRHMTEAHGELDRKFINRMRPYLIDT